MARSGGSDLRAPIFNESKRKKVNAEGSPESEKRSLNEKLMKDAKALGIIQGDVSNDIFPRISNKETSKGAWDILHQEFHSNKQVRSIKLQGLCRDFMYTRMKDDGTLYVYLTRLLELQTKDIEIIEVQEEIATLRGFSQHLDRHAKNTTKRAFSSMSVNLKGTQSNPSFGNSKPKKNWKSKDKKWDSKPQNSVNQVKMGTGDLVQSIGKGTLVIEMKGVTRYIKEVMIVPGLDENLLSIGQMVEHGYWLVFGDYMVDIYGDRQMEDLIASVQMKGNMCFPLTLEYVNPLMANRATVEESFWLWHKRYGHLNYINLMLLQEKEMVQGLPRLQVTEHVCSGCAIGKGHREPFDKKKAWRYSQPLELIHSDICGLMQIITLGGNRFFLTFINDHTRIFVYLQNRCPTSALNNITPFEAISGRKPGVKHLKIFGSMCYIHIPSQKRHKLEETGEKIVFVGYGNCEKGYRVFNLRTQKVELSRSVIFDEKAMWDWETNELVQVSIPWNDERSSRIYKLDLESSDSPRSMQSPLRSQTTRDLDVYAQCNMSIIEPKDLSKAVKDKAWKKAMTKEMLMIEKNSTWELVDKPSSKPIVGVKTLIALATQKGWKMWQLDIKSAFLNGVLEEDGMKTKCINLRKALYGLKQAPRAWYGEIDTYLIHCGFNKSSSEATLYVRTKEDGSECADECEYMKIVGSLLYLTTNIMFSACLLARLMHKPTKKHYGVAKRCYYLSHQGTLDFGIEYVIGKSALLIGYCDSDWNGSKEDMKTSSGYAFSFGSGAFSWASYVSAAEATSQAIWLRFVLEDFGEE
ncbi:Sc-RNase [Pyrus ussuriensis x Pyrus communis]|uniref:Sc-RNase n=1 Tax=Pyrus ussuriensis x Pyrus communis TaxID=2448454 RepID=A0A5N5F2N1_9ROSA|nr:Sc-RNase [Pyrus ussuriensis x Pyrus communis]